MPIDPELERFRAAIDGLNERLVEVLHERARVCRAIGAWKRARGLGPIDPAREQAMLAALTHEVPHDGFSAEALATVLRAVFAASRELVVKAP